MQCEQILYALFNGVGYKTIQTSNVDNLITEQNLDRLKTLKASSQTHVHWLETEKIVALSQVHLTHDEYGRKGVWNHTILLNITDYISYTQTRPAQTLDTYFLKALPSPKTKLEPIQIP